MRGHLDKILLYEYLEETLPGDQRQLLEQHVARCPKCARELDELRASWALLAPMRDAHRQPVKEPEWESMVESIVRATGVLNRLQSSPRPSVGTSFRLWWETHRLPVALAGTLASIALVVVGLLVRPTEELPTPVRADAEDLADSLVNARVTSYLRTSRVLLTELANAGSRPASGNMTTERRASRELIAEARYLRRQPLDEYSASVISDVDRIMLKMANLPEGDSQRDLDLLQQGVGHRNLLFRLRMAERAYQTRSIVRAMEVRQEARP